MHTRGVTHTSFHSISYIGLGDRSLTRMHAVAVMFVSLCHSVHNAISQLAASCHSSAFGLVRHRKFLFAATTHCFVTTNVNYCWLVCTNFQYCAIHLREGNIDTDCRRKHRRPANVETTN